jgi:hypothetical protein
MLVGYFDGADNVLEFGTVGQHGNRLGVCLACCSGGPCVGAARRAQRRDHVGCGRGHWGCCFFGQSICRGSEDWPQPTCRRPGARRPWRTPTPSMLFNGLHVFCPPFRDCLALPVACYDRTKGTKLQGHSRMSWLSAVKLRCPNCRLARISFCTSRLGCSQIEEAPSLLHPACSCASYRLRWPCHPYLENHNTQTACAQGPT